MKLLFLALLVSAMAVASVGFFTSRVEQAMLSQASQMLGGDLVLESARPFSPDYRAEAESLQLHQAESIHFRSMVAVGDRFQLVAVDAVSDAYPLRGQFEVADSPGAPARAMARSELRAGEVWAGQRLFTELGVRPGDTIQLGQRTFMLRQVLVRDPVAGDSLFELAPALIMPLADLESTGLLSPASRARFQLMFAGPPARIDALRTRLAPRLETTERIRSLADGAPTIRQSYERANRFLGLAALFSVVLAGAAIALTAASLIRHETPTVAVLKAFGLQRRTILRDYLTSLWGLALLAAGAGALLGYGLQWLVGGWLGSFAGIELPPAHWQPLLVALLTALVMVTGFSLPYLFNLMDTPAMQILRGNLHPRHPLGWLLALCILPAVFILLWLQAGELKLALWLFLGLLAGLLAFWGVTRLALAGLLRLGLRPGWEWLAPLRHSRRSSLLVVVFATGLFTLLLLASLRTDLVGRWQDSLPVDAPNYFLINIQPEERAELERFLAEKSLKANLFPMIRGRLTRINGEPVTVEQYADPRSRRLLEREFNLSELVTLPASNRLLAGA